MSKRLHDAAIKLRKLRHEQRALQNEIDLCRHIIFAEIGNETKIASYDDIFVTIITRTKPEINILAMLADGIKVDAYRSEIEYHEIHIDDYK